MRSQGGIGVSPWRPWLVALAATLAYVVAVMQRTSFSVVAVEASARFDVSATALAALGVAQIGIYAILQLPLGVLLDRVSPGTVLIVGALIMAVGQLMLAYGPTFAAAVTARALVGAGDACVFISILRLLPMWFDTRVLPQLTQWVSMTGQAGQLLSAVPFVALFQVVGWEGAFTAASAMSASLAIILLFTVWSRPRGDRDRLSGTMRARLSRSLKRPGTRVAFWTHLTTSSPIHAMTVVWGYPLLTAGLAYPLPLASGILSLVVVGLLLSGPLLGTLSARLAAHRVRLTVGVVATIYLPWCLLLAWPGEPPLALVAVAFLATGFGGPGSILAFDFARSTNPVGDLGTASGFANMGGFLGGLVLILLMGSLLDVAGSPDASVWATGVYRWALLAVPGVGLVGLTGLLVSVARMGRA